MHLDPALNGVEVEHHSGWLSPSLVTGRLLHIRLMLNLIIPLFAPESNSPRGPGLLCASPLLGHSSLAAHRSGFPRATCLGDAPQFSRTLFWRPQLHARVPKCQDQHFTSQEVWPHYSAMPLWACQPSLPPRPAKVFTADPPAVGEVSGPQEPGKRLSAAQSTCSH